MNEKLKFNVNRLKSDFESVIEELIEEIEELNTELRGGVSSETYEILQDKLCDVEGERDELEDKVADLEDKIEELEEELKLYKDE